MKKKIFKYFKFTLCIGLIFSMMAPSYAALSASDGSAFITKAEFDSALSDFNARLTTFEAGINSKIDSQVSSYLDRNGIWNGKEQITNPTSGDLQTGWATALLGVLWADKATGFSGNGFGDPALVANTTWCSGGRKGSLVFSSWNKPAYNLASKANNKTYSAIKYCIIPDISKTGLLSFDWSFDYTGDIRYPGIIWCRYQKRNNDYAYPNLNTATVDKWNDSAAWSANGDHATFFSISVNMWTTTDGTNFTRKVLHEVWSQKFHSSAQNEYWSDTVQTTIDGYPFTWHQLKTAEKAWTENVFVNKGEKLYFGVTSTWAMKDGYWFIGYGTWATDPNDPTVVGTQGLHAKFTKPPVVY